MTAKRYNPKVWGWVVQRRMPSRPSRKTRWRDWDGILESETAADQILILRRNVANTRALFRVVRRKYSEGIHP